MIEWGSVADWVSGVGTTAAVVVALSLNWREQKNRRQQHARNLAFSLTLEEPLNRGGHYAVTGRLVNAGSAPVVHAFLVGPPDVQGRASMQMFVLEEPPNFSAVINTGRTAQAAFAYTSEPDLNSFVVIVQDAAGMTWCRDVSANRYITMKKAIARHPVISDPNGTIYTDMV